ncbi:hypothetical protein SEA_CAMERICO_5 [Gordonia phage Camerico]|nr:hypothetical protein SEA_CAMERICO_5 [Gordonia phage Camerico]
MTAVNPASNFQPPAYDPVNAPKFVVCDAKYCDSVHYYNYARLSWTLITVNGTWWACSVECTAALWKEKEI